MPDFRRGREHIEKANESKGTGNFKPFMPNIYWKKDGEERYVLILNPIDEIPMVKMQKPFTSEGRVELVVARTDDAIGESKDPIEEEWGYPAADLNVAIAVELEAEFELVKGRKRPTGFGVKTRTFNRTILDSDGKPTDEKEECTAPVIGVIAQSPANFFNHVASQDANTAPINETAALIRRVGDDKNTDYEVELFDRDEVDLTALLENIADFSYVRDDVEDLLEAISGAESDFEAASIIGSVLLDKWLNELADREYYDSIFEQIDQVARYPKKGWKNPRGGKKEEKAAPERTERRSQRRSKAKDEEPEAETVQAGSDNAEEPEEAPKASRSSRKKADEKTVDRSSPVSEKLASLKAKAEAQKAAREAADADAA